MKTRVPVWHRSNGEIISCTEKIKVMQQNLDELQQMLQDAYEDGLLMDIDGTQIKDYLIHMINGLDNPYKD